jgi:hypothetical protein
MNKFTNPERLTALATALAAVTLTVSAAVPPTLRRAAASGSSPSGTKSEVSTSFYLQPHSAIVGSQKSANGVRFFNPNQIVGSNTEEAAPSLNIMRAAGNNATIYGYRVWTNTADKLHQWCRLNSDGSVDAPSWEETTTGPWNYEINYGFVKDGVVYASAYVYDKDYDCYDTTIFKFDLSTGEYLDNKIIGGDEGLVTDVVPFVVYDANNDICYSYSYTSDAQGLNWGTLNLNTGTITVIKENVSWKPVALAINPATSEIFGINTNGTFGKINKTNGEITLMQATGVSPYATSQGMTYSPNDGGFVWTAISNTTSDGTNPITRRVSIDPTTGVVTGNTVITDGSAFTFIYCPDKAASAESAPAAATINGVNFEKNALTGNVNLTIPLKGVDGSSLSGIITVNVYVDGATTPVASTGTPGQTIDVPITVSEGSHTVTVILLSGTVEGNSTSTTFYAGDDTPSAPSNVKLTEKSLTWSAVTTGIHNGYVDASAVTYNVYLNGTKANSTPISGTSYTVNLTSDDIKANKAEVEAVYAGKTSEKSSSNTFVAGAYSLPMSFLPTAAEVNLFTIEDRNDDGLCWEYFKDDNRSIEGVKCDNSEDTDVPSDDWMFLPPMYLEQGPGEYQIDWEVRTGSVYRGGSYEVIVRKKGADVEGITPLIAEDFYTLWYKVMDFTARSVKFEVLEPGIYEVGFHCTSAYNTSNIYIRNIAVASTGVIPEAPARATDITAKAASYGKLNADVTLTLPTTNVSGEPLSADSVTVTVSSSVASNSATGKPGETVTVNVETVQGTNTLSVVTSIGTHKGMESTIDVYTGVDVPQPVDITSYKVSEDNLSIYLEWETSTEGMNGGFVDPASVTYQVTWYDLKNTFWWAETEATYTGTDYTYYAKKPSIQAVETVGVTPYNSAGVPKDASGNKAVSMVYAALGAPYSLPMVEKFPETNTFTPIIIDTPSDRYQGDWYYNNPSAIDPEAAVADNYCYISASTVDDTYSLLRLPKFSTEGKKDVYMNFRFYFDQWMPQVDICALTYDGKNQVIGTITNEMGNAWQNVTVQLPEDYMDYKWVEIDVRPYFASKAQVLFFDGYNFREPVENDLGIEYFTGNTSFYAFNEVTYSAEIDNYGTDAVAMPKPTLTLTVGENVTTIEANEKRTGALDPGESAKFTFTVNANTDFLGDGTLTLNVNSDDDYMANNTETINVSIKQLEAFVVNDLTGAVDKEQNVILSWSAPTVPTGSEDFEDLDSFSYDDVLGQWLNIDGDGYTIWGFESTSYPGIGLAKAWQVIDNSYFATEYQDLFPASSGTKSIMAICPYYGYPADDWLISPEVEGGSTVTFNIAAVAVDYTPESVEILASSTGRNTEDFTLVEAFTVNSGDYQKRTFTLPADARYFAIHYVSADKFGVFIDDIEFSPVAASWSVDGYNVYRDGQKIGTATDDVEYTDSNAASGTHAYNVATLVNKGNTTEEQHLSNTVTLTLDRASLTDASLAAGSITGSRGAIIIKGFQGENFSVFAADGKTLSAGKINGAQTIVPMTTGVYMVKVGTTVAKIIVK